MKNKLTAFFQKHNLIFLLLPILLYVGKAVILVLTSFTNKNYVHIDMKIDDYIPFCKYFVLAYATYYFVPIIQLYLLNFNNRKKMWRVYMAVICSIIIANFIFIHYQVQMLRPEVMGNDIFSFGVRKVYKFDRDALNCFPSIHVLMGVIMIIDRFNNEKMPKWYTYISIIIGLLCIVSTVMIKQHYFIDMVVGASLSSFVYLIILLIDKRREKLKESK